MAARWSGPSPCSTPKKKMTMSRAMRKFQTGDSNTLKNSEFFAHQQSVKGIEVIAGQDLQSGISMFLVKFHCRKIIYRRLQRYITTAGFFQLFFRGSQLLTARTSMVMICPIDCSERRGRNLSGKSSPLM